jgi:chromosome segregation ATPase
MSVPSQFYSRFQSNPPSREDHDEQIRLAQKVANAAANIDPIEALSDAWHRLDAQRAKLRKHEHDRENAVKRLDDIEGDIREAKEELAKAAEDIKSLMQGDPLAQLVVKL